MWLLLRTGAADDGDDKDDCALSFVVVVVVADGLLFYDLVDTGEKRVDGYCCDLIELTCNEMNTEIRRKIG